MVRNIRILIQSLLLTSSFLTTVHAQQHTLEFQLNQEIAKQRLVQSLKNCNVAQFKTEYATFQSECQTPQAQLTILESLELMAQETKKEKITDLAKFLTGSSSEKYWIWVKLRAQIMGAVIFSIDGVRHLLRICPDASTEYYVLEGTGGLLTGALCCYFAHNNYHKAFHQKTIVKQEIIALDEIIAFIKSAKAPTLPVAQ